VTHNITPNCEAREKEESRNVGKNKISREISTQRLAGILLFHILVGGKKRFYLGCVGNLKGSTKHI